MCRLGPVVECCASARFGIGWRRWRTAPFRDGPLTVFLRHVFRNLTSVPRPWRRSTGSFVPAAGSRRGSDAALVAGFGTSTGWARGLLPLIGAIRQCRGGTGTCTGRSIAAARGAASPGPAQADVADGDERLGLWSCSQEMIVHPTVGENRTGGRPPAPGQHLAPGMLRLGLLPSGPDPVRGIPPRRTRPSTPRVRRPLEPASALLGWGVRPRMEGISGTGHP